MKSVGYITLVVFLWSCSYLKPSGLFDEASSKQEPPHIENFYGLNILKDKLNSEVWFTPDVKCIQVSNSQETRHTGEGAIYMKWDKQEGGCDWIGMGIGWDGWAAKDLSLILDKAAIEIKAYSAGGKVKALPLAVALEDYGGGQAWLGMEPKYISHKDGEDWATVLLPLNMFSWEEFGADATNIKQLIIQFEAAGEIYFDDIKVVPYEAPEQKVYQSQLISGTNAMIDGRLHEIFWSKTDPIEVGQEKVWVMASEEYLYVAGKLMDKTPMMNNRSGQELWNGDALELVFATNKEANPKRKTMLYSDQHIVFGFSSGKQVWDMRRQREITSAEFVVVKTTADATLFEARIPLSYFEWTDLKPNHPYGFEVAVDDGNGTKRTAQYRWNTTNIEGFHQNPSLWGTMIFSAIEEQ